MNEMPDFSKYLTPQQEKFAQEFAASGNREESYRVAYHAEMSKPETVRKRAYELCHNSKIANRVMQLKQKVVKQVCDEMAISKSWVLMELTHNMDLARKSGNLIAANKSLELIGTEIGMFKKVAEAPQVNVEVQNNTLAAPQTEWAEIKARLIGTVSEE